MYLVYANKNDVTNDTTALWTGEHKEDFVGTLNVSKYSGNTLIRMFIFHLKFQQV